MRTTLEKIKVSAEARLTLPAGRKPVQELARYKNFLKVESHRLKILHRGGAGGREVCQGRSAMIDELLRYLLEAVAKCAPPSPRPPPDMALVAIGGYGRGELNPHSDIDIMFLHPVDTVRKSEAHPWLSLLSEGLLYDVGLKVGYSVRSIDDCVAVANTDMQSKTSLLEARLILGSADLFKRMQSTVLAKCVVEHADEYIAARVLDQAARHAKFGNSATMLEPNIKNGCGGLRDYHNLHWLAYVKYRTPNTAEMVKQELISAVEGRQLDRAYDFLLRARNELHYQVDRPLDVLGKNLQPKVASKLGYTDRSPSIRLEQFMRDYYTHSRNIYLITRTVEQRLALLPKPVRRLESLSRLWRRKVPEQPSLDGFRFGEGKVQALNLRVFDDQPRRLLRVFLYAQQRGLELHPDLVALIRSKISLVDRAFLRDRHAHETFLQILNHRGNVAPVFRAMHEVGLLGKYIPEFGRLTNLVQHEFYHQYAADEHTLLCLQRLDEIWAAKNPALGFYTQLFHDLERPFVLYLAMLLHDTGKGKEDNHAKVGGRMAAGVAKRLELDSPTLHSLRLVIESHLHMFEVALRRDLSDPTVINAFAREMESAENLALLTLHTVADTLATSDKLWNGFKDQLIQTLFRQANSLLKGGTDFRMSAARERELLREDVQRQLPRSFSEDEVKAHFEGLPPRYFLIGDPRQIMSDVVLAHRFMHNQIGEEERALEPIAHWHNEPDRGYTEVKICTWDRPGLFCKITGTFSATGLNILGAHIFTRDDGIALDTFFVADARTGSVVRREERESFEELLKTALAGGPVNFHPLIARHGGHTLYQPLEGDRMPTKIRILNEISETHSVIDVETEDRLGLLFVIAQALTDLELDIALAKIGTEKGAAIDSFYVTYDAGGKIVSPEHQAAIIAQLRDTIERLDKE